MDRSGRANHHLCPDHETLMKWIDEDDNAPVENIDPEVDIPSEVAFSLLSHLQYTPSERNQGSCGNCWFWAGTGTSIPWANTNASYQDGSEACSSAPSAISCASIATTPDYPVTNITAQTITTHGVGWPRL